MRKPANLLAAASVLATVSAIASLVYVNETAFLILFTFATITLSGALTLQKS